MLRFTSFGRIICHNTTHTALCTTCLFIYIVNANKCNRYRRITIKVTACRVKDFEFNTEKSLLRWVQDALKDKYMEALVNENTNLISDDVSTVLEFLCHNYGKISSEELTEK